jgi:hypothetical protein
MLCFINCLEKKVFFVFYFSLVRKRGGAGGNVETVRAPSLRAPTRAIETVHAPFLQTSHIAQSYRRVIGRAYKKFKQAEMTV